MGHLLRRDAQAALLLLDKLYSGGKDVGALLNELSTLTRDLLIRMTAPEGGAALLSGGYDSGVMDGLSQGVSPTRLLFMASQLQSVSASLPLSSNRRTDAELCLMRLCDGSLCGDVTALTARLARLEEGGIPAQPAPVPVPTPVPKPKRQSAPPPPADDLPPWEDERPPLPEEPPWEEPEPVRIPEAAPVPPPPPTRQVGVPAEPPKPEPKTRPAGTALWNELAEQYKNKLTPMYWYMIDDARGVLDGDELTVYCGDDLTMDTLKEPAVVDVIQSVTAEKAGHEVRVRFLIDSGEAAPEDKLDELIRQGSKFDSFTVKP